LTPSAQEGAAWASVVLSLALQVAVIYLPFLQQAFSTVPLRAVDCCSAPP